MNLRTECAWCGKVITYGRKDRDGGVSHGLCRRCEHAKQITLTSGPNAFAYTAYGPVTLEPSEHYARCYVVRFVDQRGIHNTILDAANVRIEPMI